MQIFHVRVVADHAGGAFCSPLKGDLYTDMLQTGDLVLVRGQTAGGTHWALAALDALIRAFTHSPYTHAGLILRDPPFVAEPGLYVWESGWEGEPDPQDGRVKFGVQLTRWDTFVRNMRGELYIRSRDAAQPIPVHTLERIHAHVYAKPYDADPWDWVQAALRRDDRPRKMDRFWCSALVAYILVQCGTLPRELDWSLVRPADLSSESTYLEWRHVYGPDTPWREPPEESA